MSLLNSSANLDVLTLTVTRSLLCALTVISGQTVSVNFLGVSVKRPSLTLSVFVLAIIFSVRSLSERL